MKTILTLALVVGCLGCDTATPVVSAPATRSDRIEAANLSVPAQPTSIPTPQPQKFTGIRWAAEAARLTRAEREELSEITPDDVTSKPAPDGSVYNGSSSWNPVSLRWEEDFYGEPARKGRVGSRAILPMSVARAEYAKRREDAQWCDPSEMWGGSDGFHQYHCAPNENGPVGRKGRIEEDKEAEEMLASYQAHKDALVAAMTTRKLTDAEYKEVLQLGSNILTRPMVSYQQSDVDAQFEHALRIQEILRGQP